MYFRRTPYDFFYPTYSSRLRFPPPPLHPSPTLPNFRLRDENQENTIINFRPANFRPGDSTLGAKFNLISSFVKATIANPVSDRFSSLFSRFYLLDFSALFCFFFWRGEGVLFALYKIFKFSSAKYK